MRVSFPLQGLINVPKLNQDSMPFESTTNFALFIFSWVELIPEIKHIHSAVLQMTYADRQFVHILATV